MKRKFQVMVVNVANITVSAVVGAISALCLFYVVDYTLQRVTNIRLYHLGSLLMDFIFKPSDPLVLGYLLYFWILVSGAIIGILLGVIRASRDKRAANRTGK